MLVTPLISYCSSQASNPNNERFFDFLTRIQGKRMDDQRAEMLGDDSSQEGSNPNLAAVVNNHHQQNDDENIENNNVNGEQVDSVEDGMYYK